MKSEILKLKNKIINIPKRSKKSILIPVGILLVGVIGVITYKVYLSTDTAPVDEEVEVDAFEASALQQEGKHREAAESYETTVDLYEDSQKDLVYEQIARNYFDAGDYDSAKEYYLKLKDIYTQRKDESKLSNVLVYLEIIEGFDDDIE